MCKYMAEINFADIYEGVKKLMSREEYELIVEHLSKNWTSLDENERNKRIIEVERDYKEAHEDRGKIRRVVGVDDWSIAARQNSDWSESQKSFHDKFTNGNILILH